MLVKRMDLGAQMSPSPPAWAETHRDAGLHLTAQKSIPASPQESWGFDVVMRFHVFI